MEFNEISMYIDVKLDIYDKRPDSLKFKEWTKCQVKIEAIKCLPCFLRINFQSVPQDDTEESAQFSVSINVPGVSISLATSRTKQHSYGLFWTHNRRNCFIYFALETEMSCRKHMKWIKKSIKNLELYRQVFLEKRRTSRGPGLFAMVDKKADKTRELSAVKDALSALGPLPQIPDANSSINWSRRVSRASELYEEIVEVPRLSHRFSHASIASGIYEEMKPCSTNIHSIAEESLNSPPPLPPLPPHRKRLNTFESDSLGIFGDIPRSNTNPEMELARKKKYKNVIENIFGARRSKRSESISETPTSTIEDIINGGENNDDIKLNQPIYVNDTIRQPYYYVKPNKRNSFSSPDLSKINFLDTFDEEKLAALLHLNSSSDLDAQVDDNFDSEEIHAVHNCSSLSLDMPAVAEEHGSILAFSKLHAFKSKFNSMESLNVSGRLPQNFNFSACNTSSINLIGASSAVPSIKRIERKNIILEDELSGYCVMAPIVAKKNNEGTATTATSSTTSSTTSGYSTGSYYSSTSSSSSSNSQAAENKDTQELTKKTTPVAPVHSEYDQLPLRKAPLPVVATELSNIYENVKIGSSLNGSSLDSGSHEITLTSSKDFAGNLYENLLTIKAALELEQPLPVHVCTSTPTDSPIDKKSSSGSDEVENFYQTPRKSIVSVDDKLPSYYPNSCDTMKMKRYSNSPSKQATAAAIRSTEKAKSSVNAIGLKNLVNIKMKRERNENLYISSPQKILEQRKKSVINSIPSAISASKSKKAVNAQKISENVYAVNLFNKKSACNNNNNTEKSPYKEINETGQNKEKQNSELLHLALLQKIDFKFDDTSAPKASSNLAAECTDTLSSTPTQSGIAKLEQAELEYENCYQASKDATRLLNKYATLGQKQSIHIKRQLQQQTYSNSQSSPKEILMTESPKLETPIPQDDVSSSTGALGSKKFASLPRFKKIDFSPLKLKINNVLQRHHAPDF